MGKKRSWFSIVRRFFISESPATQEKKEKRKKWVFFGRMKVKSRLPTIAAPAPSPPRERTTQTQTRCEAEEEHSKRALNVALATAAAAEAAVAAAHAAAEVVLLTGVNHSACQCDKQLTKVVVQQEKEDQAKRQELAAIVIQSIFRGYLARKALRALKGIVKLQAIIRGRNVRRQAMNTLKCLQSIVSIQSQVSAKRIQGNSCMDQNKEFANVSSDKIIKMDTNSQKRWDGSILTKEEAKALFLSKKEAALKRERIKDYSFNHRFSAETERNKANNGRWRYWLEQWVDTQVTKSKELEDLDTILTSNPKPRLQYTPKKPTIRNTEETESQNLTTPRRSFHRKQSSLGDETSFSKSPTTIPKYMSSTESAKAKARSMSSPKLRSASGFDAYSDSYSPSKNRFITNPDSNPMSVRINGGKGLNYQQQRSPSLKGIPAAVKSNHSTLKDLSFDSDCTFKTWNHQISGNFV